MNWRKATASASNGTCVEVAQADDGTIAVRDSKDPAGPMLRFTKAELASWIDGCRAGPDSRGVIFVHRL